MVAEKEPRPRRNAAENVPLGERIVMVFVQGSRATAGGSETCPSASVAPHVNTGNVRLCLKKGDLEFRRSRGQSHYAACVSVLNFNSNSIGLT
jgi:hypothetical protein